MRFAFFACLYSVLFSFPFRSMPRRRNLFFYASLSLLSSQEKGESYPEEIPFSIYFIFFLFFWQSFFFFLFFLFVFSSSFLIYLYPPACCVIHDEKRKRRGTIDGSSVRGKRKKNARKKDKTEAQGSDWLLSRFYWLIPGVSLFLRCSFCVLF